MDYLSIAGTAGDTESLGPVTLSLPPLGVTEEGHFLRLFMLGQKPQLAIELGLTALGVFFALQPSFCTVVCLQYSVQGIS